MVLIERKNVRDLSAVDLPWSPDVVVADLSFISLTVVLPALTRACVQEGDIEPDVVPDEDAPFDELLEEGTLQKLQFFAGGEPSSAPPHEMQNRAPGGFPGPQSSSDAVRSGDGAAVGRVAVCDPHAGTVGEQVQVRF